MEENWQKSNNRMVLLLIAGIPVMVVLIATWLWYYVVQGDLDLVAILGTSNNGDLVQPPRQLVGDTGEPGDLSTSYGQMEPKWQRRSKQHGPPPKHGRAGRLKTAWR